MDFNHLLADYGLVTLFLLALFSFMAGFIDAVVGGGGLIIIPFLLINFPKMPIPVLFGTNKISALSGTSISAIKYAQRIKIDYQLLLVLGSFAFIASFIGAKVVSFIDSNQLKPFILGVLILIAIYTFIKKDLGAIETKELSKKKQLLYGAILSLIVGFYDGFFGPGTGSFFVLGFVVLLGFEFVKASAYSKIINCITNISALVVFIKNDQFILPLAIIMAVFNISGSYIGTNMALKRGNGFVRKLFLVIVSLLILKFGYDIFA